MNPTDLRTLLDGGELDAETIARLRDAEPDSMRALLGKYLRPEEVDGILARVQQLIDAEKR